MSTSDDFAEWRHERLNRMLSRADLGNAFIAAELGVDEGTVSRWRNGRAWPRRRDVQQIARLLAGRGIGVTVDWLEEAPASPRAARGPKRDD